MEIILTKKIRVKRCKILAEAIIQEERPDVQQLLKYVEASGGDIPKRLEGYLNSESLLNDGQLTDKGRHVIETGMLSAKEAGIYSVWYLEKDPILGNLPLLIQRISDDNKKTGWSKTMPSAEGNPLHINKPIKLSVYEESKSKQRIVEMFRPEIWSDTDSETELDMALDLKNDALAEINLAGHLSILPGKGNKEKTEKFSLILQPKHLPELLNYVIRHLRMAWISEHKRAECDILGGYEVLNSFSINEIKTNSIRTSYGDFDSGYIKNLLVMPKDGITADKWHIAWLVEQFRNNYLTPGQHRYEQQWFLSHPAIKGYDIPPLDGEELLSKMHRNKHPEAFWHAAAMNDLLPGGSRVPQPSLTYRDKTDFSIADFIRCLTLDDRILNFIYSDRHYKTKKHYRNLNAITRIMDVNKGMVFSLDNKCNIPRDWELCEINKSHDNHDRYWIFQSENRSYCWKCSTSLDFIDLSKTSPVISGAPTFTLLSENELPTYLMEALQLNKDEEVCA